MAQASACAITLALFVTGASGATFAEVAPILERHCVSCHQPQGSAPMAFTSYAAVRPWAKAIAQAVAIRRMPPWFATAGKFANDPSLSEREIAVFSEWAKQGAQQGPPRAIRIPLMTWTLGVPEQTLALPTPIPIPKTGEIDYQYVILPTGFKEDRWVQKVEVMPTNRRAVHHAVVYIREPSSSWLRNRPAEAFTVAEEDAVPINDLLHVYTPGNPGDQWAEGMAKLIPAGSDLVFQIHYTAAGGTDQTRIGLTFAKSPPLERVLTLQLTNDRFVIPPGVPAQRVQAWGTLPNRARLLSLFPHMHLRGAGFEYRMDSRVLLKVEHYDFGWQLNYRLAEPLDLPAGTRLEATGIFDNSRANPRNPDPGEAVRFGYQSREEMMIGFFDVAVPAGVDKRTFFIRGDN